MKKMVLKQGDTRDFRTRVVFAIKETGEILGSIIVSVPLTLISSGEQAVVLVEEGSATSIRRLSVGERIKALRIKTGMSQKALADKLGKAESTVRMWELGKSEPNLETMQKLAYIFKVDMNEMFGYQIK